MKTTVQIESKEYRSLSSKDEIITSTVHDQLNPGYARARPTDSTISLVKCRGWSEYVIG